MLARSAAGGSVCLRCRLQQLRLERRPAQASASHSLLRQRQQVLRSFATESSPSPHEFDAKDSQETDAPSDSPDRPDLVPNEHVSAPRTPTTKEQSSESWQFMQPSKPSTKNLNLKRRVRSGRRIFTETTEKLGPKVLGQPAHAIVLKEGHFKEKKVLSELAEDKAVSAVIETILQDQRDVATHAEARANIDEMRPVGESAISRRQFKKLTKSLTDGFLSSQLKDYIQHTKMAAQAAKAIGLKSGGDGGADHPDSKAAKKVMDRDWVKSVTPWAPIQQVDDTTDGAADTPYDRHLQGYTTDEMTPKEKFAIRVIRECWNIELQEMAATLGQMAVKIRANEFVLLMRGTQRFVKQLGDVMLEPGEKIEVSRNNHTITFTITKAKSDSMLVMLANTLKQVTAKSFPIKLVSDSHLASPILEEVARLTSSHVRLSHTNNRFHVTWIELASRAGKKVEDLRHQVFRLLLTGLHLPTTKLYTPQSESTDISGGRYILDRTNQEKWAWTQRLVGWARFVMPFGATRTVDGAPAPSPPPPTFLQNLPIPVESRYGRLWEHSTPTTETTLNQQDTNFPRHPVGWSQDLQKSTVTHFGHVLHRYQPAEDPETRDKPPSPDTQRIFSPVTPHPFELARLADEAGGSGVARTKSTIVIRFWPSPSMEKPWLENMHEDYLDAADAAHTTGSNLPKPKLTRKEKSKIKKQLEKVPEPTIDSLFSKPSKHLGPAPIIELRLSATEDDQVVGVESVRAILDTDVSDVLVPSSLVDLRVTNTTYCPLEAEISPSAPPETSGEILARWQPVADFLQHATLDLAKGKLEMPPRQRFPVPRRLFRDFNPKGDMETGPLNPDELISTTYEFVGLELHRAVSLPYRGFRMEYTSIEAGQGGGRRAELGLEPVVLLEDDVKKPELETVTEDFPVPENTAEAIAQRIAAEFAPTQTTHNETGEEENRATDTSVSSSTENTFTDNSASTATNQEETQGTQETPELTPAPVELSDAERQKIRNDFLRNCYDFAVDKRIWCGTSGVSRPRTQ